LKPLKLPIGAVFFDENGQGLIGRISLKVLATEAIMLASHFVKAVWLTHDGLSLWLVHHKTETILLEHTTNGIKLDKQPAAYTRCCWYSHA
jgi:hypothetical protein